MPRRCRRRKKQKAGDQHRPLHLIPCPVAPHDRDPRQPGPQAGNYIEARMADYDPAPTSDEEIEQAYQEKYG